MKPFYIIVAIVVVVIILYLYLYFYKTHTNETYTVGSPFNLIVVDENGNMSTVDIHPPALNEAHIPPSTNIVYTDTSGNLGVMAYKDIGGSNRNILTVDANNNNFSVLTPPTVSISIVSVEQPPSVSKPYCVITFSVLTDPNLYPVTNYTFQMNNQSTYSLTPEPDKPQIYKQSLYVLNSPINTFSFKVKATNDIGTGPYSATVSSVINIPISVVIKSASTSTITLSVSMSSSIIPPVIKYEYSATNGILWNNATYSSYTGILGNYTIVIKTQYNMVPSIPIIVRVTPPTPGVPVTSARFTPT